MFTDKQSRTCAKCGFKDSEKNLFRFPKPGARNALGCEAWARFTYPGKTWHDINLQKTLHFTHKVLCSKHFKSTSFTDVACTKLHRNAIPGLECEKIMMTNTNFARSLPAPVLLDPTFLGSSQSTKVNQQIWEIQNDGCPSVTITEHKMLKLNTRECCEFLLQRCSPTNSHCSVPCVNVLTNNCDVRQQGSVAVEDGYIKKFMKAVGWMDQSRTRLKLTGYFLYESIPTKVKYTEWFSELELPDTFASWFNITELHVWMLMVRYMAEDLTITGPDKSKYVKGDGHFVRNCIIEAMWADVGNKIKLLEGANPAIARKQVSELSEQFQAALVAYDEGLSDDKVLAAAVWRRFYNLSEDARPENVERIVKMTRQQISTLDKIPSENLKWNPEIPWISILEK